MVIKLFKIVISVGGEDASEMAINYGYVIQSVEYLLAFIKDKLNVDINKKTIINGYPDFPNGKWNIDIRAEIYIRVINILKLGYFALVGYLKFKNNKFIYIYIGYYNTGDVMKKFLTFLIFLSVFFLFDILLRGLASTAPFSCSSTIWV